MKVTPQDEIDQLRKQLLEQQFRASKLEREKRDNWCENQPGAAKLLDDILELRNRVRELEIELEQQKTLLSQALKSKSELAAKVKQKTERIKTLENEQKYGRSPVCYTGSL